ncbi:hypothetical protein JCM11251_001133 [Rhodosporidiobolus azoricus]
MAHHTLLTFATLASLLLAPCSASSVEFTVPPLAIRGPSRLSTEVSTFASVPAQPVHAHLSRHRRRSPLHDPRIEQRQVHNVRAAAKAWEKRDEVAKRASPSNVPKTGICLNSVGAYQQCGGLNYDGDTCCSNGWTCTKSDDYYSQCRPSTTTCNNAFYGQCGGLAWLGPSCCPEGSACVAASAFYAQCVPGGSASSSTSVTTAAPTTTTQSSSSSSSSSKTTQPPSSSSSSSSSQTTTSSSRTTSSTAAAPTCDASRQWQQCGGQGFTGSSCCLVFHFFAYDFDYHFDHVLDNDFKPRVQHEFGTSRSLLQRDAFRLGPYYDHHFRVPDLDHLVLDLHFLNRYPFFLHFFNYFRADRHADRKQLQCESCIRSMRWAAPTGYACEYDSVFYSQCRPSSSTATSSSAAPTSPTRTSTATSSAPTASSTGSCKAGQAVSDGCIVYSLTALGITLPSGSTFLDNGHVNYQAISKDQYRAGETYTSHGSQWTPRSFGTHFESLNNQPSGVYIGKNYFDFAQAKAAFPNGYCITWIQMGGTNNQFLENPHFGEGGQAPICT